MTTSTPKRLYCWNSRLF